jgi:beta-glucanase (GH16 family)
VSDGRLYILPTLTTDSVSEGAMLDGSVYNITDCTFNITRGQSYTSGDREGSFTQVEEDDFDSKEYYRACSAVSNATAGTIINPIQSARISTRRTASIRYGKVEVRAKIPTG